MGKGKTLRFSYEDDVILLREIVAQNSVLNPERWELVKTNVERITGKGFQVRTLKNHLQLLSEVWNKKEDVTIRKSGEEEPYSEKDNLLQEISNIRSELKGSLGKTKKVPKEKILSEMGRQSRDQFAIDNHNSILEMDHDYVRTIETEVVEDDANKPERLPPDQSTPNTHPVVNSNKTPVKIIAGPSRNRGNKSRLLRRDALSYLSDKQEREFKLKQKEVEMEERKIMVEERKVAIEERKISLDKKRFELETKERLTKLEYERNRFKLEIGNREIIEKLIESKGKHYQ